MVTITVGKDFGEEQEFVLPREYLTDVSEFFENSFMGSFREANEMSLKMDDVKVKIFRIFVEWLYGRKLLNSDGEEYDGAKDGKTPGENRLRFRELLATYVLADGFDIPGLRKDVLQVFAKYQDDCPKMCSLSVVTDAYNGLPPNSPFLSVLVDVFAYQWDPQPAEAARLPHQLLGDVVLKLRTEGVRGESPYENPAEYYESHIEEERET